MTPPALGLIVVNYQTPALLAECLESLRAEPSPIERECIVVDNNSGDESAAMVRARFPEARLVANSVNVGYATAVNQAIALSRAPLLLILNADTRVLPGALVELIRFMDDHPECGIAGPRLEFPDGRLQPSCRTFYTLGTLLLRRTVLGRWWPDHPAVRGHLMLDWDHAVAREVDWMLGAAMAVRRAAIDRVGPMDGRYFLYLEDVDWCFRMRQAGWKVLYCPTARIVHHYRRASAEPGLLNPDLWIHLESAVRYYDKWGSIAYLFKRHLSSLRLPVLVLLDWLLLCWLLWGFTDWPWSAVPPAAALAASIATRFYRYKTHEPVAELVWEAFRAVASGLAAAGLFFWATRTPLPHIFRSRWALLSALPQAALALALLRSLLVATRRWLARRHFPVMRCVIADTGPAARRLAAALTADPSIGYDVAGFAGEDPAASPYLGDDSDLPALARKVRAQEVIFVQADRPLESFIASVLACRLVPLDVKLVLSSPDPFLLTHALIDFGDQPALDLPGMPLDGLSRAVKRAVDVAVSAAALLASAPAMALAAAAIRFFDGGPVLATERHLGAGGQPFDRLRFRTAAGAGNPGGPGRVGAWLARRRLDRLPELANVLRGEMSLVGPRPTLPDEALVYTGWHHCRLGVRPGVTGLWQVEKEQNKWRLDQMLRLDMHYVLHRSLLLDLRILLKSLVLMLSPK